MDVSYTGTASVASIWVVGYGEEAHAGVKVASCADFLVEVVDHGDVKSSGTRLDPIFAKLIPVL